MPNTPVRAAAEGMPAINRRSMLLGLAAASTATAVTPAAKAAPAGENPALLSLAADFDKAKRELADAREARDWIIAEWRHLWPLAPDEMAFPARYTNPSHGNEFGLDGKVIVRSDGTVRSLYSLESMERMADPEFHSTRRVKSAKRLASIAAARKREQEAFHLAKQYHAETERIREASGIDAAKVRIAEAHHSLERVASQIMAHKAVTMAGLAIQIEAYQVAMDNSYYGRILREDSCFRHSGAMLEHLRSFIAGGAA